MLHCGRVVAHTGVQVVYGFCVLVLDVVRDSKIWFMYG